MVLLDAHDATRDGYYLEAARKAADALVFGQHPLGGWHYFIDFDPKGTRDWYEQIAKHFRFGYEEYRHHYGNATFDDSNSSDGARFLLRFYATTLEAAYRPAAVKALDFLLQAQYPNGAWPQRFPLRYEFAHDGMPDYTSLYTLNDGAAAGNVQALIDGYETLGDERYLEGARRGVDFMIAVQGPVGQAAWAEQYGPDLRPAAARTHEPAGYVLRESREVVELLEMFYLMTGDPRYLRPIGPCLDWFDRVNRESVELRRPVARYYQPGTNLPVYVNQTDRTNSEGYGLYDWTTTPAAGQVARPGIEVAPLRAEFERLSRLKVAQARAEYAERFSHGTPVRSGDSGGRSALPVAGVLQSLDARGAWVEDRIMVLTPNYQGPEREGREPIRGISTATYVRNMRTLLSFVRDGR
jgi:PelA/Pel-15E family pectate lyase